MLPVELMGMCVDKPTDWLNRNVTQLSDLEDDVAGLF